MRVALPSRSKHGRTRLHHVQDVLQISSISYRFHPSPSTRPTAACGGSAMVAGCKLATAGWPVATKACVGRRLDGGSAGIVTGPKRSLIPRRTVVFSFVASVASSCRASCHRSGELFSNGLARHGMTSRRGWAMPRSPRRGGIWRRWAGRATPMRYNWSRCSASRWNEEWGVGRPARRWCETGRRPSREGEPA